MQAIDPGLLQMGERGPDEARRGSEFVARIVPIPALGNKRIEIEYHQRLSIEQLKGYFAVPLKPDVYRAQTAGEALASTSNSRSDHALRDFNITSKAYPLQIRETQRPPGPRRLRWQQRQPRRGPVARVQLDAPKNDTLAVITHRDPNEPGFFEAERPAAYAPAIGSAERAAH